MIRTFFTTVICFSILITLPCKANLKAPGYFIKKNGDTVHTHFEVPVVFELIGYYKLQERMVYFDSGTPKVLAHDTASEIFFTCLGESFTYVPVKAASNYPRTHNKPLFLRVYQKGNPKIVLYYFGNAQIEIFNECIWESSGSRNYLQTVLIDDKKLLTFHKSFWSSVEKLFSECSEGYKEAKRQRLDCQDISNLVTIYQNFCKK